MNGTHVKPLDILNGLGSFVLLLASFFVSASPASAQFLYINNNASPNQISAFRVNADGTLTPVPGAPFFTGGNGGLCFDIDSVTVRGVGKRIYATNYASGNVSGFDIKANGSLTPVPGSPFPTSPGGFAVGVAASADGKFLFVGRDFRSPGLGIDVFRINVDGSLARIAGSPFGKNGAAGFDVVFDPKRNNVISNVSGNLVSVFDVGSTGALSAIPGSPFEIPTFDSQKMALRPQADCLFVAGGGDPQVSALQVAANGALSNTPGSPYEVLDTVIGATVTPNGKFAYFGSGDTPTISGFSVGAVCSLTTILGSPFISQGNAPSGLTTDDQGRFLFSVNSGLPTPSASSYVIAANGVLTPVVGVGGTLPLQGSSFCPVGIAFIPPKGVEDDDDFDDDGDRDDRDPDDDDDGKGDDDDSDDDNDGIYDDRDRDDDNDGLDDEFDGESTKEVQNSVVDVVAAGQAKTYDMVADLNSLLLIATAEAASPDLLSQPLVVEIVNPRGIVVAQSPPVPGRAVAMAVPLPGNYKVRIRNTGQKTITYTTLKIVRENWLP